MEKEVKICQSCSMPMVESGDFGTEEDGSSNQEYCRYCFQQGEFTDPGINKDGMIEKLVDMAEKMGKTKEETKKMAEKVIPTLRRWQ